ncbi:NHL repeat-containing protein 2 [Pseudolycoriella hygida]|uniref:NHL repeat-containing protein 2 n=1 Tax=Pseudolycoriella hygida TaxID=35572 RepID=A0A9Q0NBM6_9DIPT|nr:NHL repeat-containing protein 2 [Pseudolycoriella hygida]
MEEDTAEYDMIDLLAYECIRLNEALSSDNITNDEQNEILMNYLKRADLQHKPINEFKEDLDWFNVLEPLSKEFLSGKVVVLDFFTYCCINCIHMLPDLKKIEESYSVEDGLVVIGVHSAKFANEKDSANILSAVQRYNITHPVVNDHETSMWMELKLRCWPTIIILGPKANPIFVKMGEGNFQLLEKYVAAAMKFYKEQNQIKSHSLPLNPAADLITPNLSLKFPGKIACTKTNGNDAIPELYAISDTGNHRIIIITASGEVINKIGGKQAGYVDGDLSQAKFNSPQGVCFLNEKILFVADTENHAVRRIDLIEKSVTTIAGTGVQGFDFVGGKMGAEQEISSPWDVAVYKTRDMDMTFHLDGVTVAEKNVVIVAAAGTHQIWAVCIDDVIWWKFKKYTAGTVVVIAGNGKEENRNNSYPQNAAFAQPSGLSIGSNEMFIADSESSCIRKLSLVDGKVLAVVGGDRNPKNLFAYGDVDGQGIAAKLQHPLGVCFNSKDNSVYVADSYNHKIKRINVTTNHCETCNIVEESSKDVMVFSEPGGLCLNPTGDTLYVANTNNHSIELVDLHTMISNPLKISFNSQSSPERYENEQKVISRPVQTNTQGGEIKLSVTLNLSTGICFTSGAPQKWSANLPNERWSIKNGSGTNLEQQPLHLELSVSSRTETDSDHIKVLFQLNLCATDVCFPRRFVLEVPVVFNSNGVVSNDESILINISRESVQL